MEIALFAVGMALLVSEVFVPGAVAGIVGAGLVVYAIGSAWWGGHPEIALPLAGLALVAIPALVVFALRRVSLGSRLSTEEGFQAPDAGLEELVGSEGVAVTALRPSGTAQIGDRRVSVVSEMGLIDEGTALDVVRVEGYRVVVRGRTSP